MSKEVVKVNEMSYHNAGSKLIRDYNKDVEDSDGYKITYENGHVAWIPKFVFDTGYALIKDKKPPSCIKERLKH